MTNKTLKVTPANTGTASGPDGHASKDLIEWTSIIHGYPSTVTPTHGDTTPFVTTNFSTTSNITGTGSPYKPVSESTGWNITKNSNQVCEFNIRFGSSSSIYHKWMPATIFAGGGFNERNITGNNSNFRIRRIAFVFRNMDTNAERIYSPGWDRGSTTSTNARKASMDSATHYNIINSWGNRWRLYQTIINVRSNSTSAVQQPKMRLGDLRYYVRMPGLTGTTKLFVPQHMSWNDFLALDAAGQRAFSSTY